jgi:mono/diheme cytochrome c family protein
MKLFVAAIALVFACAGALAARADNAVPSAADLSNPQWIAEGKTKFVQACAYCHGVKGEAGKTKAFAEREDWDPQVIHDTIVEGKTTGSARMPAWGGSIPGPLIWKIVAYIKSLSAANDGKPGSSAN